MTLEQAIGMIHRPVGLSSLIEGILGGDKNSLSHEDFDVSTSLAVARQKKHSIIEAQPDLIEVVHWLRQVVNVKG